MVLDSPELTLLDTRQYADLRRISPGAVRAERSRGTGPPFIKTTENEQGRCYYRLADVVVWLRERTQART